MGEHDTDPLVGLFVVMKIPFVATVVVVCVLVGLGLLVPQSDDLDAVIGLAESGDADAQFNLGINYEIGNGVSIDVENAASWLRRAADQGHSGAQFLSLIHI